MAKTKHSNSPDIYYIYYINQGIINIARVT